MATKNSFLSVKDLQTQAGRSPAFLKERKNKFTKFHSVMRCEIYFV